MTSPAPRPVSVLIAALGGQGGGVLTDWIVAAAEHAGLAAQATSIPGVAQRTGATTYYLEVHPVAAGTGAPRPVFSLYPTPGDVDVIIASEFLEAGRTLELDYASPERTTLVASTHRLFAIGERTVLGDGVFPAERLREAARAVTRRTVTFDALAAARTAGSEVNAVLLGAFAATGALPIPDSAYEAAIREGVAAERNLAGFKAGREIASLGTSMDPARPATRAWTEVRAERAAALARRGLSRALRHRGSCLRARPACDGGRSAGSPRRLPGRALRGALPHAGARGPCRRPGHAAHRALRPSARGVGDI
jgi:indolepyruvate ferredoxin oxidoreductase, beta subunit